MPHDPLLPGDVPVIHRVEEFEYPVHKDVVGHSEDVMQELSEGVAVHHVQVGRVPTIQREQSLDLEEREVGLLNSIYYISIIAILEAFVQFTFTNISVIFFSCFFIIKLTSLILLALSHSN